MTRELLETAVRGMRAHGIFWRDNGDDAETTRIVEPELLERLTKAFIRRNPESNASDVRAEIIKYESVYWFAHAALLEEELTEIDPRKIDRKGLCIYLESNGWRVVESYYRKDVALYHKPHSEAENIQIPSRTTFADYATVMLDNLEVLAQHENRPIVDVYLDIISWQPTNANH